MTSFARMCQTVTLLLWSVFVIAACSESAENSDDNADSDEGATSTTDEEATSTEPDTGSENDSDSDDIDSSDTTSKNLTEGNWVYTVTEDGTEAVVLWGDGTEKSEKVVMVPSELGGLPVITLGSGDQNVISNNKTDSNFVLLPLGISTIGQRAIYDYNDTAGWVFPDSIETIFETSLQSCQGGTFYIYEGSAADDYVKTTDKTYSYLNENNKTRFSASSDEHGYIQPNGSYDLPSEMLDGSYTKTFNVYASIGYKISKIMIDGASYDFLGDQTKMNEVSLSYTFTSDSSDIVVAFEEDPEDTREEENTESYTAPDILEEAVSETATLPDDVNTYVPVNDGTTSKYTNSMGISTGLYYAADDTLYEMIGASQTNDEPEYYSKAEVINGVYESNGWVYGEDYDMVRLYNYYEEVTAGPAQGVVAVYASYFYKEVGDNDVDLDDFGIVEVSNDHVNTAALFAQEGANITIANLTADVYTASMGPSESGNFYGVGSAIHIDGGDANTPATNVLNTDTAYVKLENPQVLGTVNSIYSLASGLLEISGGNIFSKSSGGHGPYVSTGGQIIINTESTDLIDADGNFNIDTSALMAVSRPEVDLGTMVRNASGDVKGVYADHDDDVTIIVTGDEAGTALATDSGGGVIVANQVVAKAYGLRSGGVYSIGSNESWVYTYNSTLVSYLDAGLVSASGGYLFAFNSDIYGVMGLKTRAGGNATAEETGIHVQNSRVSAYYDYDEMVSVYDVADPADWRDEYADLGTGSDQLNIFIDKANSPTFQDASLEWWFKDKSLTPGYSGGNKFAVIYVENSATPIFVTRTQLLNKNYAEYGVLSEEAIAEGQIPADNLIISVEGGGTGNIYFTDENSNTPWDLTEESDATTEIVGDFYVGAVAEQSDDPNMGSGSNGLNATFVNSEWQGTVRRGDNTGAVSFTFDDASQWTITSDAIVSDLVLASAENIVADAPVQITVAGTVTIDGEAVTQETTIANVTYVFDPDAIELVEGGTENPGGMDPADTGDTDGPGGPGDLEDPGDPPSGNE